MAVTKGAGGGSKPYKPVTVFVTKNAKRKDIPVQRSVRNINEAAGAKIARVTSNRKDADIIVSPLPKKKLGEKQGSASRINKNREQIEKTPTKVKVYTYPDKALPKGFGPKEYVAKLSKKKQREAVPIKTSVTTHELGHAFGLGHHEKRVKRTGKLPPSLMAGGYKLSNSDVKRIKKVTGYKG